MVILTAPKHIFMHTKTFQNASLPSCLETVQDFVIKLGIKPLMHLLEISIFLLNNDIVRLTKIMNNLVNVP